MLLAPGTVVERYQVVAPLGRGGMASVWLVHHQRLGTRHALKVLHGGSASMRERLLREGQAQGNLRHTNIVSVTDVIEVAGAPGLVMELVTGPNLAELLQAGPLAFEEADALARPILDGVVAAHRAGLVHRDLKPSNILIAVEEERLVPKIADFGLAKLLHDETPQVHATRSGAPMGTPAYMAPEQIRDASRVDARADVFALGCILYELVTGRTAFVGQDAYEIYQRVIEGRFDEVRAHAPHLPAEVVEAIHGALVLDPEQRTPTAEALRAAWIGDRPSPVHEVRLVERARSLARAPESTYEATPPTWEGPSEDTWATGFQAPPADTPSATPAAPRRLLPWAAAGAVLLGLAVLWFPSSAPPPSTLPTSTSAVVVSADPVVQQQFEEGWRDFLAADFRRAERKLRVVADDDPPDPLPWMVLAETRFARGDVAEGVQAIWTGVQKAETFDSDFARLVPHLPSIAVAGGWAHEAGDAYRAYLDAHPQDYFAHVLLLYSPASLPVPAEDVEALFAAALAQDPEPALPYYFFASDRLVRGLWDEAGRAAEDGLRRSPGNPALLQRWGRARLHAGDFAGAKETLREATLADPGLLEARSDLALAALYDGDEALRAELEGQLLGSTVSLADRLVHARVLALGLLGMGRVEAAEEPLLAVERAAREANAWPVVLDVHLRLDELHALAGDLAARRATLDRLREAIQAPEISSALRQRHTETLLLVDAQVAARSLDVPQARALRDRLAALPEANAFHLRTIDHALAIAKGQPEDLDPHLYDHYSPCTAALMLALDHHAADPPGGLVRLGSALEDTSRCSAVGRDRWLIRRAEALLSEAEVHP